MPADAERRDLAFQNLDEALADAEQLASGEVRTSGKHSYGQILNHLALSLDVSTGRVTAPPASFFMRLMMPLIKRSVFSPKPLKPGIKLPSKAEEFFWPDKEIDVPSALQYFRESVEYYKTNGPTDKHQFWGKVTKEQDEQLNCRHASLHLGFVHPA